MPNQNWSKFESYPLPWEQKDLPTVIAQEWIQVGPPSEHGTLEGPIFYQDGNLYLCYTTSPEAMILKITPEGNISEFCHCGKSMPVGLAVHKDGRIFGADITGSILIFSPEGQLLQQIPMVWEGQVLKSDDLVFDESGNLYVTDFRGSCIDPIGGVYVLSAASEYRKITRLTGGLAAANGISFSPDFNVLWVAESGRNCVLRIQRNRDGAFIPGGVTSGRVFRNSGRAMVDSNKVDSAGNVYQAIMHGGRLAVLNRDGVNIGNILAPGRMDGKHLFTPNVVLKPGTTEGYMVASGAYGAWILKFPALAEAQVLFSHL